MPSRLALFTMFLSILTVLSEPASALQEDTERYDIVLAGGRVMDPETGLDAVRYVGIREGRIAAISSMPLVGDTEIDVSGLVVAPGFVDLHAHGQDSVSRRFQVRDGVTTALELEGGVGRISQWYEENEGRSVINFGATISHGGVRANVLLSDDGSTPAPYQAADADQLVQIEAGIRAGLDAGALGIGFGIQYHPASRREEILRMFGVAAAYDVTNFVHNRDMGMLEPGGSIDAVQELIANAAITGASVHLVHIGSSGLGQVPLIIEMISGAQRNGVDITTEVYPYTAASTDLSSALFDEGWRARFEADYDSLEWVATGERLTEETFHQYRQQGGMIIAHMIPEAAVNYAVAHPLVMIASDGVPYVNGRAHPRGAGSFARVLGRFVREQNTLTLMEALRKMSLMPARRLENVVPQMRTKGRLQVGSDADVTVFDPNRVIDRATFAEPAQFSDGIVHVLVNGTFVVRDEEIIDGVFPGVGIRREPAPIP